jgi:hypothetical protein
MRWSATRSGDLIGDSSTASNPSSVVQMDAGSHSRIHHTRILLSTRESLRASTIHDESTSTAARMYTKSLLGTCTKACGDVLAMEVQWTKGVCHVEGKRMHERGGEVSGHVDPVERRTHENITGEDENKNVFLGKVPSLASALMRGRGAYETRTFGASGSSPPPSPRRRAYRLPACAGRRVHGAGQYASLWKRQ